MTKVLPTVIVVARLPSLGPFRFPDHGTLPLCHIGGIAYDHDVRSRSVQRPPCLLQSDGAPINRLAQTGSTRDRWSPLQCQYAVPVDDDRCLRPAYVLDVTISPGSHIHVLVGKTIDEDRHHYHNNLANQVQCDGRDSGDGRFLLL